MRCCAVRKLDFVTIKPKVRMMVELSNRSSDSILHNNNERNRRDRIGPEKIKQFHATNEFILIARLVLVIC